MWLHQWSSLWANKDLRKKKSQMGSHTHLTLQQPPLTKFSKISKSCENWETTVCNHLSWNPFLKFQISSPSPRTVVKSYTIWAAVLSFSANVSCVRVKFARYNTNNTSCKKIHKTQHNNGVQIRYVIILSCMLALLLSTSCSSLIACCYLCWGSDTIVAVLELSDLKTRLVETNK